MELKSVGDLAGSELVASAAVLVFVVVPDPAEVADEAVRKYFADHAPCLRADGLQERRRCLSLQSSGGQHGGGG